MLTVCFVFDSNVFTPGVLMSTHVHIYSRTNNTSFGTALVYGIAGIVGWELGGLIAKKIFATTKNDTPRNDPSKKDYDPTPFKTEKPKEPLIITSV